MRAGHPAAVTSAERGRSSGVEHNLAKVGVEGSNPFARSRFSQEINGLKRSFGAVFCFPATVWETGEAWGKQQEACRSGRSATFGMGKAPNQS